MTNQGGHVQEQGTEDLGLRTNAELPQATYRVTVTHGPDAPRELVVDGSAATRLLVGTGSTCHLVLTDRAVSRRHLALSLRDGLLHLEDQGSTNGTFIGTLRVGEVAMGGGEEISIGSTRLRVDRLAGAAVAAAVARSASFGRVLGASDAMRRLYPLATALASSPVPMLIEGETGTGKELLAEVIHEQGPRSAGSFVVLDPVSTAPSMIDAALFGLKDTPGLLDQAHGGTLVLDEPAELPLAVQNKIARFLEKRPVTRADGSPLPAVDARVIAISRGDVEREVQDGRLREDLAAILGAARLELPPLRRRAGDVVLLATAFFKALRIEDRVLPPITLRRFEAYSWPGNVRELERAVARYATTGDDATDARLAFRDAARAPTVDDLHRRVLEADLALGNARDIIVADFERRFVQHALARHGGNVTRAAAASGVARRYFHVLKSKLGV